ncbi:glycosyltransferase family 2 protein [Alkalihalobacillus sp. BA299]|uniref:glycosyltransferase family 2 protein n=1 Tax=Alkalihalobacillus sp. BA299 TaxID=2815938 RepID=UPI001ADBEBBB|nr:glycosyltransferase family 2 protein [Alkalihalobacillus sp. BA299]
MVSVITCTMRQNYIDNVFENYNTQGWRDKELIIILNKDNMDLNEWENRAKNAHNVSVYQLPEKTPLGQCLNFGVGKAKYDYIAKFDDDDYYSTHYLTEAMLAFNKINTQIIGKTTYYAYIERKNALIIMHKNSENQYVNSVAGGTLIFKKNVFQKVKFGNRRVGSDQEFLKQCRKCGFRIYSTNKENYTLIRKPNQNHHTWKDGDDFILRKGELITFTDNFKSIVSSQDK